MDCDVLIVGARVAGSSLALLLARRGLKVLLIDRDAFPSDTLSTHFMDFIALRSLAKLGVLPEVEAAGFRRVVRHRTWVEACCIEAPAGPDGAYSLTPRRDVLDSVLAAAATRSGAQLLQRTTFEEIMRDGDEVVGARIRTPEGSRSVRAAVVVGADGRYSKVAEQVGAPKYEAVPSLRSGFYGYYRGIVPREETTLEVWFHEEEMGFLMPMRPGEDCVALEVLPEHFDSFRDDLRTRFEARVRALPGMGDRFSRAIPEGAIKGTRSIENYLRTPCGPGWALIGDAAYLKDPSTGIGIGDALAQAFLLDEALAGWFGGAAWETSMGDFQRRRDDAVRAAYQFTLDHSRRLDPSPETLSWMKAAFFSPALCRALMHEVPRLLPVAHPPHTFGLVKRLARAFGVPATATLEPARVVGV